MLGMPPLLVLFDLRVAVGHGSYKPEYLHAGITSMQAFKMVVLRLLPRD